MSTEAEGIINFMEQSSAEADGRSAGQEIPPVFL
jgi:hypothetical protein